MIPGSASVTSFNSRTGAVSLSSLDVTSALGFSPYNSTNPNGYLTLSTLPAQFTFNVAADDSTLRTISTEETVKFIGAGGITTATDAEGAVTITQGSTDTVIKVAGSFASNSAFKSEVVADLATGVRISTWWGLPAFATEARWTFDYDGILTFPDGTEQTTAWTGTSTTLQWTAAEFFPSAPAQTTVTAGDGALDINLVTGMPGSSTSVNWSFTNQGTIVFPDETTQYSAYSGTSSTTEALTIGTGLSGTLFDGSTAVTIAIDSTVALRADTHYIGTTSIALNRASASQTLTGVSIDGNAATVTNGVYTTGSYVNPSWITSLAYSKLTGVPAQPAQFTFNVAADDSAMVTIGSEETVKFIGAGGITTASDAEGTITITQGAAAAGTLTGTTLNSTVLSSSLTSVGTLRQLTVAGSTTAESFNTDQITVVGNRIATTVTNANLELEPNGTGSVTTTSALGVTYTPATTTGSAITATGKDTQGGTGYFDFLKATNTTSGVANGNKTFRLTNAGAIEIINSAYTATLFSLTDTGGLSVSGTISISGKKAVNGPAFRAYVSVGQTITSGSQQRVTFGTENFDTDSCFATNTFTPTVEGYYQLNATVRISGGTSTGECMIVLYKNGTEYARGNNESGTEQGASFYSMQVSDIAYANGTTDNFDVRIQQTSGSDKTTTAGSTISYFSGCMIRGA